jgi:hypothetical protein
MRRRYQHVTSPVLQQTAAKVGGLLWGTPTLLQPATAGASAPVPSPTSTETEVYVARLGERRIAFRHREHAETVVSQWGADHPGDLAENEKWDHLKWEQEGPGGPRAVRSAMPDRRTVHHAHAVFLLGGERLNVGRPEQWSVLAWEFEADLYTDLPIRWHTTRRPGQEVEAHVRGTDGEAVAAAMVKACAQAVDRAKDPGKYGDAPD